MLQARAQGRLVLRRLPPQQNYKSQQGLLRRGRCRRGRREGAGRGWRPQQAPEDCRRVSSGPAGLACQLLCQMPGARGNSPTACMPPLSARKMRADRRRAQSSSLPDRCQTRLRRRRGAAPPLPRRRLPQHTLLIRTHPKRQPLRAAADDHPCRLLRLIRHQRLRRRCAFPWQCPFAACATSWPAVQSHKSCD